MDADGIRGLEQAIGAGGAGRSLPPVHLWHPEHCGEIDIVVRKDGTWLHEGTPIRRPELVRLFSTVLRLDPDGYHLVTPVEKLRIQVEDLPFQAVALETLEGDLIFHTDVGDRVVAGADHAITVEVDPASGEPRPRLHVRRGLEARISRPVFYELVERAELDRGRMVLISGASRFDLGPAT